MWVVKFFIKTMIDYLADIKMRFDFFRLHRVFLPRGAVANRIDNIKIGKQFTLAPFCQLFCQDRTGSELVIGDRVSLNYNVMVNADGGKIYLGNNVIIGPQTVLRAANHRFEDPNLPIRDQGNKGGAIVVEDDVWIGANVVVLPDVKIGKGSVIGAGSVVTRDIPEYSVAVGVPARVIKSRKPEERIR
jgi:galactoside O-acetyltransferase